MTPLDPFAPWRLGLALWTLGARAQVVVALRTAAMMGVLPKRPGEDRRMVEEKLRAFALSGAAAGAAMARGADAQAVAEAALRPVSRRAGRNAKRLLTPPKPRRRPPRSP